MAHPLVFPRLTYFYPVGNTSPVNLTQDIAPEQSASILLLGCGDPRSILFTLHMNAAEKDLYSRKLDITCCDVQPAVLARNILLFTLIIDTDTSAIELLWNIFYDFYINSSAMQLLVAQCRKLANLSTDLAMWHESSYGSLLRVCSQFTLSELNRYWNLYAAFEDLPTSRKAAVAHAFSSALKKPDSTTFNYSSARSAGPLFPHAVETMSEHFDWFWSHGINTPDKTAQATATLINPTFVYSNTGEGFAVHYGTDAFASFHVALAFARATFEPESKQTFTGLYSFIQSIFRELCVTFKAVAGKDNLTLRFMVGEALAFCSALHSRTLPSGAPSLVYATPWKAMLLELGGDYSGDTASPAPVTFDVIETSNLTDHLGLLNILIVAVPILSRSPSSTVYTETLLITGDDPMEGFRELFCGDITTTVTLLDLVPASFVSKFTSHSNAHEILFINLHKSRQFHERIVWKIMSLSEAERSPSILPSISFDAKALAGYLFKVYLRMFSDEDMGSMISNVSAGRSEAALRLLKNSNLIHYTRRTFAAFLKVVKHRVAVDWGCVMDSLFLSIESDRTLLMGTNYYQDLCCQLHLLDVYSVETFIPNGPALARTQLRGWRDTPPVVFVSLVVPRQKLKRLEDVPLKKLGTPLLQFLVRGVNFENIFLALHTAFGTLSDSSGPNEEPRLVFTEDGQGWASPSDLVVTIALPTWIFSLDQPGIHVGLGVRSTLASAHLLPILGFQLTIYETAISDRTHVFFSRAPPSAQNSKQVMSVPHHQALPKVSNRNPVTVAMDPSCEHVSEFIVKAAITDPAEQTILAPSHVNVVPLQTSPCGVLLKFGRVKRYVQFPFPVIGSRVRLRVARKSHYIEVIAQPSGHRSAGGFYVNNFPLVLRGKTPAIWNIHRVPLARLPIIKVEKRHEWFNSNISLMMSDFERATLSSGGNTVQSGPEMLSDMKETMHRLFVHYTGIQGGGAFPVFGLNDPEGGGGIYAIFFISHLRLDVASHTFVLDGYVLPITHELPTRIFHAINNLNPPLFQIKAVGQEMLAWQRLLPALVERCRETWLHLPSCEYAEAGKIPSSLNMGDNPICSCGVGKDIEGMQRVKDWAQFAPFCTRVAISPLFAVSYMEKVAGQLKALSSLTSSRAMPPQSHRASHAQSTEPKLQKRCEKCGSDAQLKLCSRCKRVRYCSAACQKEDWRTHKIQCC